MALTTEEKLSLVQSVLDRIDEDRQNLDSFPRPRRSLKDVFIQVGRLGSKDSPITAESLTDVVGISRPELHQNLNQLVGYLALIDSPIRLCRAPIEGYKRRHHYWLEMENMNPTPPQS